jgi:MFS family permease
MPPLCALAGALLIGYPMQRYGRRTALIGLSVPFFLGFILMGFTYLVQHKAILFIGRLMSGLMNGAATPASQIYVIIGNIIRLRVTLSSPTFQFVFHRLASVLLLVFVALSVLLRPALWRWASWWPTSLAPLSTGGSWLSF